MVLVAAGAWNRKPTTTKVATTLIGLAWGKLRDSPLQIDQNAINYICARTKYNVVSFVTLQSISRVRVWPALVESEAISELLCISCFIDIPWPRSIFHNKFHPLSQYFPSRLTPCFINLPWLTLLHQYLMFHQTVSWCHSSSQMLWISIVPNDE